MRVPLCVAAAVQIAGLFVHPHLQAQQSTSVGIGSRVRLTVDSVGLRRSGKVVALTRDSLMIAPFDEKTTIGFRRDEVSRLEISSGQRRNTLKGLGLGLAIGAGTGALLGFASGDDKCGAQTCFLGDAGFKAAALGIFLGALGGVSGTVKGALTTSDRWVTIAESTAIVPVIDARGRLGLALRY